MQLGGSISKLAINLPFYPNQAAGFAGTIDHNADRWQAMLRVADWVFATLTLSTFSQRFLIAPENSTESYQASAARQACGVASVLPDTSAG